MSINIINDLDFADTNAVLARAASLATNAKDKDVLPKVADLMFGVGQAARLRQMADCPATSPIFAAFRSVHYAPTTGRTLTDNSAKTYASALGAFAKAGFLKAWDGKIAADFVLANAKGAFTQRGGDLVRILDTHPEVQPTEDQMRACLTPEKVKSARDIVDGALAMLVKAFGPGGDFAKLVNDNPVIGLAYMETEEKITAFRDVLPQTVKDDAADRKARADKKAAFKAAIKAAKEAKEGAGK